MLNDRLLCKSCDDDKDEQVTDAAATAAGSLTGDGTVDDGGAPAGHRPAGAPFSALLVMGWPARNSRARRSDLGEVSVTDTGERVSMEAERACICATSTVSEDCVRRLPNSKETARWLAQLLSLLVVSRLMSLIM